MRELLAILLLVPGGCRGCPERTPGRTEPAAPPWTRGPVIDSHTLVTPLDESLDTTLRIHDRVGVVAFCNKNGGPLGSPVFTATVRAKHRLKERFAFFANVAWQGVNEPGWGEREADRLDREVRFGAKGVKIFKSLGLGIRDADGKLLHVDDPRLDPLFERAAALNVVVALHTGDPKAFFEPVSPQNERWDELKLAPSWSFHGEDYPPRAQLLAERDRVLDKHRSTTFLLIHLANNPEDLAYVARLLEAHDNAYVDTSARVPEIGRHPAEEARELFIRFQDRILFGTDLAVSPRGMQLGSVSEDPPGFEDAVRFYEAHFRFFETADRQFPHPTPIQGRWKIDGIHLPPPVLRKLYHDNARRLIFDRKVTVPVVDPFDKPRLRDTPPPQ